MSSVLACSVQRESSCAVRPRVLSVSATDVPFDDYPESQPLYFVGREQVQIRTGPVRSALSHCPLRRVQNAPVARWVVHSRPVDRSVHGGAKRLHSS